MTNSVGQDDEVLGSVQQLSRSEQNVRKRWIKQTGAGATGAVPRQYGIRGDPGAVGLQRADSAVVHLQFRQRLAAAKMKILNYIVAFDGLRIIALRLVILGKRHASRA